MIRFGICAKFDKLNDIIKAGFDYIEPSLSYIAAMSDEEFAEAEKLIAASPLKAEAYNSFFPSSIKVVGENVDADAITAAFQEFTAKKVLRKPSIRKRLALAKEKVQQKEHRQLDREKAKVKDRGVEL